MADPCAVELACLVEITEPGDDGALWWQQYLRACAARIGACLDELAVRIETDPYAREDTVAVAGGDGVPRCSFNIDVRWRDGRQVAGAYGCMRPLTVAATLRKLAAETRSEVLAAGREAEGGCR